MAVEADAGFAEQKPERDIVVYGHPDGFPKEEDFTLFIREGIFARQVGRYRYSQTKNADIIILSWNGKAYGHFEIVGSETPTENDKQWLKKARKTYLVGRSFDYKYPVNLYKLDIKGLGFGLPISEGKFDDILGETGGLDECDGTLPIVGNSLRTEDFAHGQGEPYIPDEEGKKGYALHIRYERSRKNRAEAIRIHGTKCQCCGFDFNTLYGNELARDYIEVHHNRSIAKSEGVPDIKDLVPLCSNCHSMVHRRDGEIIPIEELRKIMKENIQSKRLDNIG